MLFYEPSVLSPSFQCTFIEDANYLAIFICTFELSFSNCARHEGIGMQTDNGLVLRQKVAYFIITLLSGFSPALKGTRTPREREEDSLTQFLSLFSAQCSSLYLLILVSSYVIIDIWRQGLFIFMSDHLHILSSSYLAKS